jgi:hypothetical protein
MAAFAVAGPGRIALSSTTNSWRKRCAAHESAIHGERCRNPLRTREQNAETGSEESDARATRAWSCRIGADLPPDAKAEKKTDRRRELQSDGGAERCLRASLDWLAAAQDLSASADGASARHYSLVSGWGKSYPETTGYIAPTWLTARARAYRSRCRGALATHAGLARVDSARRWRFSGRHDRRDPARVRDIQYGTDPDRPGSRLQAFW